ncbi:Titin [Striga asiatica]|uniref:Titin n=1 Tax=Striga asiatica TaxID=4170 RepID=A0A5A7PPK9_STRAF|nr:Titin [Striga asiatica]
MHTIQLNSAGYKAGTRTPYRSLELKTEKQESSTTHPPIYILPIPVDHLLLKPEPAVQPAPCPEHEHRVTRPGPVEPPVHIPHQVHQQPVHEYRLISPKIPSQPLHPHHRLPVDPHRQPRLLLPHPSALDPYLVGRAGLPEPGPRSVDRPPREMLLPGDQAPLRGPGPRPELPGRCLPGQVAECRADLGVDGDEDVETVDGLGPGLIAGRGEVPVDLDGETVEVDGPGAFELPEEAGVGGELEGGGVVAVEGEGEALGEGAPAPGQANEDLLLGGERQPVGADDGGRGGGGEGCGGGGAGARGVGDLHRVFAEARRQISHLLVLLCVCEERLAVVLFVERERKGIMEISFGVKETLEIISCGTEIRRMRLDVSKWDPAQPGGSPGHHTWAQNRLRYMYGLVRLTRRLAFL